MTRLRRYARPKARAEARAFFAEQHHLPVLRLLTTGVLAANVAATIGMLLAQ